MWFFRRKKRKNKTQKPRPKKYELKNDNNPNLQYLVMWDATNNENNERSNKFGGSE